MAEGVTVDQPTSDDTDMVGMDKQQPECLIRQPSCTLLKAIDRCTYKEVTFEEACNQYPHFKHAAHCMIFARDNRIMWNEHKIIADVMVSVSRA